MLRLFAPTGAIQGREGSDDRGFRPQDQLAERSFVELGRARGFELRVRPAAFGADCQGCFRRSLALQNHSNRWRAGAFREQDAQAVFVRGKSNFGLCKLRKRGQPKPAGLLGRFEENFLPALGTLGSGGEQRFFAAGSGERDNRADSHLGGFFERPFKCVELYDGKKKHGVQLRRIGRQFIDDCEFDALAAYVFDACKAHMLAVAEFVELARLRAQNTPEVMRRFAFDNGAATAKFFDKKTPPHASILAHLSAV